MDASHAEAVRRAASLKEYAGINPGATLGEWRRWDRSRAADSAVSPVKPANNPEKN